jgi:uncharacterized protein DUF2809
MTSFFPAHSRSSDSEASRRPRVQPIAEERAHATARVRVVYFGLAVITIGVGLVVHFGWASLNATGRDMLGDALWASMIAWGLGALAPSARLATRGAVAYTICVVVEVSQLYHTPALDAVRETTLGHLVLGSGFDPRDLLSYGLGVAGAVALELAVRVWKRRARVPA